MITKLFTLLLFFCCSSVLAYEDNFLNMKVPSNLQKNQITVGIQHRFNGKADDASSFFGMDSGANIGWDARYRITEEIDLSLQRIYKGSRFKEWVWGGGFTIPLSPTTKSQLEIYYMSYKKTFSAPVDDTQIHLQWNVQQNFMENRLKTALNIGIDLEKNVLGSGLGIQYFIWDDFSVMGEFFPSNKQIGQNPVMAFGFRYDTFGHHFMLMAQNTVDLGAHRLMKGTNDKDWHLGFTIQRILEI